ncbi:sugar O-acetyltransferase [Latilactobacillus sakei]|uniref:sugar O-acetyltransferase n=1 Tax=Latilactobacillus sakei TaxID=1599 RepID=UPI0024E0129A|nr:sugar O-acetyltransferase [Latilactobacillus sakei]
MTEKERMVNGQIYRANDAELRADMKRARVLTRLFNQTTEEQQAYRRELTHQLFAQSGADLYIEPPFRTDYGCQTTIGQRVYMNYDCIIIDVAPVTIGDNVFFGPRVGLYTAGHPISAQGRRDDLEYGKPITIGNNVVIGSGSVVTKDIPDNVIAVGNPCRVLRPIDQAEEDYWAREKEQYFAEIAND